MRILRCGLPVGALAAMLMTWGVQTLNAERPDGERSSQHKTRRDGDRDHPTEEQMLRELHERMQTLERQAEELR